MKTILGIGLLYLLVFSVSSAEAFEDAPRITDKEIVERLTRLEEGQKALGVRIDDLDRHIDQRFTDFSKWFDELRQLMLWGFGVSFAGMFALISLVIWDLRTTLAPTVKRIDAMESRLRFVEETLTTR